MTPTLIRPELSVKNKYRIDKHRYYELKHFCLQYKSWKEMYYSMDRCDMSASVLERRPSSNNVVDLTSKQALQKLYYLERITLIERTAMDADKDLCSYILKAVTEELSYTHLKSQLNIPCSRDMYYDRYRRFFWLLSLVRD